MDLNFVRLVFTLKLEEGCADPYVMFGLKPYFMDSVRLGAGCGAPGCEQCSRKDDCVYHRIFSQPLTVEPAALKRYQKPSYPFVFDIPVLPPLPNAGRTVEIGLTLAGLAVNHVDELIAAIRGMLTAPGLMKRVRTSLVRIESSGYDGSRVSVSAAGKEPESAKVLTLSLCGLQETVVIPAEVVTVTIMTPMRIMSEGGLLREVSFSPFIRALLRRISSMVYYYGDEEEAEVDFKWLAGQSHATGAVAADFRWVEEGSRWSGLLGSGTFTGVLPEFHPFLLAGEYLHVGKGASFGLGAFRVNKAV